MIKKLLAFIPGKTGSVGLPGKLFKKIGSFTLLEWTLLAAYRSKCITEIVVSSNDPLIKKATESFSERFSEKRITFIQRPDILCTPTSKTEDAISHMFNNYPFYQEFDYLITLQATSPARRHNLIDACFKELYECSSGFSKEGHSLLTVEDSTPFFWRLNELGQSYPTYSLSNRPMRQDLSPLDMMYKDNGNIYITGVKDFLSTKLRISGQVSLYVTDKFESMQIDTLEDFIIMNKMYQHYGNFL